MNLTGVFVPLITPFDEAGEVAYPALERLAHEILDAGATGLVALGTTAEPSALTPAEQRGILSVLSRVSATHHAPLIAGTAAPASLAEFPQVIAALTLVPPFVRPGPDGVVAHFEAVAAASPVPLIVYHVPPRTAQPLDVRTLRRLAGLDRVIGVKYATGALDRDLVDLLADPPPGFAILCGDDVVLSPMLALGACGGVLASAHLATSGFAALVTAWQRGDVATARRLGHDLAPLSAALFAEPNPTVVKAVLHARGRIPTPHVRLPLLPASADSLRSALPLADSLRSAPPLAGTARCGPPLGSGS